MNTSFLGLPLLPIDEVKRKRVLLVDASSAQCGLRADVMRKLGMDVDCASDIGEARSWWKAGLYSLVLINLKKHDHRDKFCDDIRAATPPQRLAFLVGKPEYLSHSPNDTDDGVAVDASDDRSVLGEVRAALSADLGDFKQRWGLLEASRRISAVRSACSARTRALRDRPAPSRNSGLERQDQPLPAWSS